MILSLWKDSQLRSAFRLALLACVLAIAYLAFAPLEHPPGTSSDKLNHLLAFWTLGWLADRSYPGLGFAPYRWTLLLGYGLTIELIQGLLPYRELSFLDFAADAAGFLGYSALSRIPRGILRRRKGPGPQAG